LVVDEMEKEELLLRRGIKDQPRIHGYQQRKEDRDRDKTRSRTVRKEGSRKRNRRSPSAAATNLTSNTKTRTAQPGSSRLQPGLAPASSAAGRLPSTC